jgi:hypothetical protein
LKVYGWRVIVLVLQALEVGKYGDIDTTGEV